MRFLALSAAPEDFLLATEPKESGPLERIIAEAKPNLVIIDSLRAFAPDATSDNPKAAKWLNTLLAYVRKYGVCFLLVHHVRKPKDLGFRAPLGDGRVSEWMLETEGARALVNQSDVRIALEQGDFNPAALRMKWSRRMHGDSPLLQLERVFRDDGEPAGYQALTGVALLSPDRRAAFEKLPNNFRFKDAKAALKRSDAPTDNFLKECMQLGVIEKLPGGYRKIPLASGDTTQEKRRDPMELIKRCYKWLPFKGDTTLSPPREQ